MCSLPFCCACVDCHQTYVEQKLRWEGIRNLYVRRLLIIVCFNACMFVLSAVGIHNNVSMLSVCFVCVCVCACVRAYEGACTHIICMSTFDHRLFQ